MEIYPGIHTTDKEHNTTLTTAESLRKKNKGHIVYTSGF